NGSGRRCCIARTIPATSRATLARRVTAQSSPSDRRLADGSRAPAVLHSSSNQCIPGERVHEQSQRLRREHPFHHPDQPGRHHRRLPVRLRQWRDQRYGGRPGRRLPVGCRRHRLQRRLDAAGLRGRRLVRRHPGRPLRPPHDAAVGGGVLHRLGLGLGHRQLLARVRDLPRAGRIGGRRGQREVAGLHLRGGAGALPGRLATVQQIAIISGLFASFLSNYILARLATASTAMLWWGYEAWRWMFWAELVPATLFLLLLFFIPESPRYLVARGLRERATSVLTRLYGALQGERKLGEIDASLGSDHHRPRLSDLINKATGKIRPIVWVGVGLATFQQFVGINVVFYYGAVLWQAVGFSENDALAINVLSGGLSIGACIVTVLLIDRVGRKPLLWLGSVGMAITLGLVTYAFSTGGLDDAGTLQLSDSMGLLALVAANAYVVFFNMSWGPVMWVMLGEMFPNQIRGSGLAVAGLAQWTANFLITWTFPMLLAGLGLAFAYGIYTVMAVLSVFFVLRFVHETKGRELEQMEG